MGTGRIGKDPNLYKDWPEFNQAIPDIGVRIPASWKLSKSKFQAAAGRLEGPQKNLFSGLEFRLLRGHMVCYCAVQHIFERNSGKKL